MSSSAAHGLELSQRGLVLFLEHLLVSARCNGAPVVMTAVENVAFDHRLLDGTQQTYKAICSIAVAVPKATTLHGTASDRYVALDHHGQVAEPRAQQVPLCQDGNQPVVCPEDKSAAGGSGERIRNVTSNDSHLTAKRGGFQHCKGGWILSFAGETALARDLVGLRHIHELLRCRQSPVSALVLDAAVHGRSADLAAQPILDTGGKGLPLADSKTIRDVRSTAKELELKIAIARKQGRSFKSEANELIQLRTYLSQVCGLRGRVRHAPDALERARTSVAHAIRRGLREISRCHPNLGRHLFAAIKAGRSLTYSPSEHVDWDL